MSKRAASTRSTKTSHRTKKLEKLVNEAVINTQAMIEGPTKKKTWSIHDLKEVRPMTVNQENVFMDFFQNNSHVCMHGSAGTGKAQPLYSNILTPHGWKLMGDIQVGDTVVTPNNKNAKVVGVYPQGIKPVYEIVFHDGSRAQSCDEHLWEVFMPTASKRQQKQILPLSSIINTFNDIKNTKGNSKRNISVRLVDAVEMAEADLPIDPYSMGLLLGDGCFRLPSAISFSTKDPELLEHLSNHNTDCKIVQQVSGIDYVFRGTGQRVNGKLQKSKLYNDIQNLGLHYKLSNEKFIPDIYKYSSIEQRLSLLQGLMDTDGTVGKRGSISFCTVSPTLAKDVQELVWSIGGICTITCRRSHYMSEEGVRIPCKIAYTLHIRTKEPKKLFRLERKKERLLDVHAKGRIELRKRIVEINQVGHEECQCIMIDDPEHLYITDNYTITHNTFLACYLALNEVLRKDTPQDRIIIVRSAVPTRDIGFLPGDLEEKSALYELPYQDIFGELCKRHSTYDNMKEAGLVQFCITSFVRGLSWDDSIIIVDEAQNMSWYEIDSILTRVGVNSRVIVCGDAQYQCDLKKERSGFLDAINVMEKTGLFGITQFTSRDIVRSEFVKSWIISREQRGL